ncbi:MAG TPA: pilus assembly protein PilP [Pseudomonadales bacterium]|jgi:type IV pilus assembly protein PilP
MKAILHHMIAFGLLASLVGCSGSNIDELNAWMDDVKKQDHGTIEPLPTIKPYTPFNYNATALRAPFDIPVRIESPVNNQGQEIEPPDPNRVREELEQYNLESLVFVGVWTQDGQLWALIDDGQIVHKVREGNYIGRNYGRIVEATPVYLSIIEKVSNGSGGWLERPRTMKLKGD